MSSRDATVPAARRARKSLGVSSLKAVDKENATIDMGTTSLAVNRKKSRSKSLGPGGLDALKQATGNRRASLAPPRSILKPTAPILPEIPPHKGKTAGKSDADSGPASGEKVALRTEEEQQAAAREREERERRDARRKSLANRRVSFAEQATLHTFHEIEYLQDSTTSTDSTRRASSLAPQLPATWASNSDRESTPQTQVDGGVPELADNQRELHQRNRRRSSGVRSTYDQDDDTIASTVYSSDSEGADVIEEVVEDDEDSDSSSDSDDDGTMVTIEAEEMTSASVATVGDESSTLEEALRLAASRAGAQHSGEDETGEEVIPEFGWIKKGTSAQRSDVDEETAEMEMEMDITRAGGGIIKSAAPQDSSPIKDISLGQDDGSLREETMDISISDGGILHTNNADDEDMSMELTTAVGRALGGKRIGPPQARRRTIGQDRTIVADMTMDMTCAGGRILPQSADPVDSEGDQTMGMEITMPVGRILGAGVKTDTSDDATEAIDMEMTMALGNIIKQPESRAEAKRIMEEEVDTPDSPSKTGLAGKSAKRRLSVAMASSKKSDPETPESLGLSAFRGKGLRRSVGPQAAVFESPPKSAKSSPKKLGTPLKGSSSAVKTPRSTSKSSASPRRTGRPASPKRQTPEAKPVYDVVQKNKSLFAEDPKTGARTPSVVLTPQKRRLSGVGADRSGLGSPRVAAILDRRVSIGDSAESFTPVQFVGRRVMFDDPREMEKELVREMREEEEKENRRNILEREANGEEATLTLREMIDSLSPKRNPLRGRKSLHAGSARGILGKRPIELDDEEEEERDGVKRLKGHNSPVKNIRMTRSTRRSTEPASSTPSASNCDTKSATTPRGQGRFKDIDNDRVPHGVEFEEEKLGHDAEELDVDDLDGRIHLQDFLNMTSIRFMELTTSKRRQTQMPTAPEDGDNDLSLERCAVSAACTVPMLSLYQHSCREIKKYMSEGQRDVKKVELETYEENPPLFNEYMSATPDIKALMDNQFKNVKTHARLLSKAMWYEWRMKLQEGLKSGLAETMEGMEEDDARLGRQQELLDSVLPDLTARHEMLAKEHSKLEQYAHELADCDTKELAAARDELVGVERDMEEKRQEIARLRQELEEADEGIARALAQKQQCLDDMKEAEKIREECRGWSATEINHYKARVAALEKQYGWSVTGVSNEGQISMSYQGDIEIVFDASSFKSSKHQRPSRAGNTTVDVWYIGANRDLNPQPLTLEKDFFLQCIRDVVRTLPQSRTSISQMLGLVRAAWDLYHTVEQNIRLLNVSFPTEVRKTGDEAVAVVSTVLVRELKTKVEVTLGLRGRVSVQGVEVVVVPEAMVVYGEGFNPVKMTEFLRGRVGERVKQGGESWCGALVELHAKLLARGRKEQK